MITRDDDTVGMRAAREGPPDDLSTWDRYGIGHLLGSGGMGDVYRAYDPRLRRNVAIKILRGGRSSLVARFVAEAQAQARIDHEGVCKVHEVGEHAGLPYIAMQLLEGRTLKDAAKDLSVRDKVAVMADVADAVHAAHRIGLIHRDVKPTNVMIERRDDGGWRAFIMDFGIVRELSAPGLTTEGGVLGTPQFMAPEQARGDKSDVDPRTDVYGLGATLYDLLCGAPPFDGDSFYTVIDRVIRVEPPRLRRRAPAVPRDLERCVMRCLDKDPDRRYFTARALAEDLRRFLADEPVHARPPGLLYRAGKVVRRHRALSAVSLLAAAALVAVGGLALRAEARSRERAQLAQRLGASVRGIEMTVRVAQTMPLHDLRPSWTEARRRMRALAAEAAGLGDLGIGPLAYALGRASLAIGNPAAARAHLDAAWRDGFRTAGVAWALGQALGQLYKHELDGMDRQLSAEQAAARRAELAARYRDPALVHLKQAGAGAADSPAYGEALLAFYEERHDVAIAKAREALRDAPWLLEARRLEADALRAKGDLHASRAAYEAAAEHLRSDPLSHLGVCQAWHDVLWHNRTTNSEELPSERAYDELVRACDRALVADPDATMPRIVKSQAHWMWSELQLRRGGDALAAADLSILSAEEVLRARPQSAQAFQGLADALATRAQIELARGQDPRPTLVRAHAAYETALAFEPKRGGASNNAAFAWLEIESRWYSRSGQDPRPAIAQAMRLHRHTMAVLPRHPLPWLNMGNCFAELGAWEMAGGGDPRPHIAEALRHHREAIERDPAGALPHINIGIVEAHLAHYLVMIGEDPRPAAQRAIAALRASVRGKDQYVDTYVHLARAWNVQAEWLAARREDATAAMAAAAGAVEDGRKLNPKHLELELEGARQALLAGQPERAAANVMVALAVDPQSAAAHERMAAVHLARGDIDAGLQSIGRSLGADARSASARVLVGSLHALRARKLPLGAARAEAARAARAAYAEAVTRNKLVEREVTALLAAVP